MTKTVKLCIHIIMHIPINSGMIWKLDCRSIIVLVSWLIPFIKRYYLRYFNTMWKDSVIQAHIKMFNTYRCRISLDCERLLISLNIVDLVILFKPKLGLFIYLSHLSFSSYDTRMMSVFFDNWCQKIGFTYDNLIRVIWINT